MKKTDPMKAIREEVLMLPMPEFVNPQFVCEVLQDDFRGKKGLLTIFRKSVLELVVKDSPMGVDSSDFVLARHVSVREFYERFKHQSLRRKSRGYGLGDQSLKILVALFKTFDLHFSVDHVLEENLSPASSRIIDKLRHVRK